ncbi:hypothetical protein BDV33DRAFT_204037 [Aspergillus novoparasiticus]|uniref:Uncharacterized protein n=1 Tax=Aspergillus novoparasiticus TaxID=986946 RepID=A0A5N6ERT9_9EURO|nr:hypothetical protein BDV33DRAFT_204037 [Aspergillus novoparasiticus]
MTNQENTPAAPSRAAKTQARAAAPVANDPTKEDLTEADYIEPIPLDSYGEWSAELKELKKRTRWGGILEPGKFYPHRPVDRWHYHVYQQYKKTETPRNPLVSRCFNRDIHGDAAVVRSSDVRVNDYSEEFPRTDMAAMMGVSAEAFDWMVPEGFPYVHNPMTEESWMPGDLPSE